MAKAGTGGSKKYLTKDELLEALSVKEEDIEVPGMGLIRVRGLPVREGIEAFAGDPTDRVVKMALAGIIQPVLTKADLELLLDAPMGPVQFIVERVMALTGVDLGSEELMKQAEDFLKKTRSENSSMSTVPKSSTVSPSKSET